MKKKEEGRRRTVKNWNTEREIVEKPSLIYIYIYVHALERDVYILGQHFHSIGFTRFFPRFLAMLASSASAFSAVHNKFLVCGS